MSSYRDPENATEEKILKELKEKTGEDYSICRSILITPDNKDLYPNFTYFGDISSRGSSPYCYFGEGKAPCTWASEDIRYGQNHPSNPNGLIPTYHELMGIYRNFNTNLCGTILYKDTRVCRINPPLKWLKFETTEEDVIVKTKLPPNWRRTRNKEGKYYYWETKKKISQWGHPWPTMIEDMEKFIDRFQDVSENYTKSIHSNMDFKGSSLYKIIGAIEPYA